MIMIERLRQDIKDAMKRRDAVAVSVLRMLLASIKNAQIDSDKDFSDEDVLAIINKEVKKRKDSIMAFAAAGRNELAEKERAETAVLKKYLPEEMSDDELRQIIHAVIEETGAASMRDMGKVMGAVMGKVQGKADGERVKNVVSSLLS